MMILQHACVNKIILCLHCNANLKSIWAKTQSFAASLIFSRALALLWTNRKSTVVELSTTQAVPRRGFRRTKWTCVRVTGSTRSTRHPGLIVVCCCLWSSPCRRRKQLDGLIVSGSASALFALHHWDLHAGQHWRRSMELLPALPPADRQSVTLIYSTQLFASSCLTAANTYLKEHAQLHVSHQFVARCVTERIIENVADDTTTIAQKDRS